MASYTRKAQMSAAAVSSSLATNRFIATPSFSETLQLREQEDITSALLTSGSMNRQEFRIPQQQELLKLKEEGKIAEDIWNRFVTRNTRLQGGKKATTTDWRGLAAYANESLGTEFDFDEGAMNEQLRAESIDRQEILQYARGADSFLAETLGSMWAMRKDPVQMAAMIIPGTQFKFAATPMKTAAMMALREGAVNVGFEGVMQVNIASFKQQTEQEYRISDGASSLLAAFVFGGAVGSVRTGYRYHIGDSSVADGLAANRVVIDELSARTDLDSTERVILRDLKHLQEVVQGLDVKTFGKIQASSARDVLGRMMDDPKFRMGAEARAKLEAVQTKAAAAAEGTGPKLKMKDIAEAVKAVGGNLPRNHIDNTPVFALDPQLRERVINEVKAELLADSSSRLPRGEVKQLTREIRDLQHRIEQVTDEAIPVEPKKGLAARKAKKMGAEAGRRAADDERAMYQERISAINDRLDAHDAGAGAEADLTRLDQGLIPERYRDRVAQAAGRRVAGASDEAMIDDLITLQEGFREATSQGVDVKAAQMYNTAALHEQVDAILRREMTPMPKNVADVVVADVEVSTKSKPMMDTLEEDYVPRNDPNSATLEFVQDEDGNVSFIERNLGDSIDEMNTKLKEDVSALDAAKGCILGN